MVFNIFSVVFVDEKAPLPLERAKKRVWPDPVARKHGITESVESPESLESPESVCSCLILVDCFTSVNFLKS